MHSRYHVWLVRAAAGTLGALLTAGALVASAPAGPVALTAGSKALRSSPARAICTADLSHPIDMKVTRLDPIRRGRNLRARVEITSRVDLDNVEVQLVHAGGASIVGPARTALGTMHAGAREAAVFTVAIPASGKRFLLQFRARGRDANGLLARGAVLNLLPDGPSDPGRVVTDPATGIQIHEYAARRIGS